jgi:hypothetical protein
MAAGMTLHDLWNDARPVDRVFRPERVSAFPAAARRYLEHAIAPGTPLASAVRLEMHGEIKLKGWSPFHAEEVINIDRGMIWRASVRTGGFPIRGSDRIVDGEGRMRWKLIGLIPILTASGADISRSAAGRLAAELIWLPSALCSPDVTWLARDDRHIRAVLHVQGHDHEIDMIIDDAGRVETVGVLRWGNPEGRFFHGAPFGGPAEDERTFGGYTIPARLRVGWFPGTSQFGTKGEFFRVTIDDATYR